MGDSCDTVNNENTYIIKINKKEKLIWENDRSISYLWSIIIKNQSKGTSFVQDTI